MAEIWRDIKGHEGAYQVSDRGRVRSLDRVIYREFKGALRAYRLKGRILKLSPVSGGYMQACLGREVRELVHVLVLATFVCPRPHPSFDGAHWNGTRSDNRLTNLRWASKAGNQADRIRHGTSNRGDRAPSARLTWEAVHEIRKSRERVKVLMQRFNISRSAIYAVRGNKSWVEAK